MPRRFREHTTAAGITVRSGFEKLVLEDLDRRGVSYEYEPYSYNWFEKITRVYCGECESKEVFAERWYTPDVYLGTFVDDQIVPSERFVEIKGKFTAKDRKIALGMKEAHPFVELRFLFQRNNTLTKASSTRYTDWCDAHGFLHCVSKEGVIPEEWV